MKAKVFSPTNIALAKYWGKRDLPLNLPANGSISATLDGFGSTTSVEFKEGLKGDTLKLNGIEQTKSEVLKKVSHVLDLVRLRAGIKKYAEVISENNFPTGAGLASSASGLSALTLAALRAADLNLPTTEVSAIARQGSGSACRSIYGGFVEWHRGELSDGSDSVATSLASVAHWPLRALICVVSSDEKKEASTSGMEHVKKTSPFYTIWVNSAQADLPRFREAILEKDFQKLAALAEANCLRMHASAMAAKPPVLYWKTGTTDVMAKVHELRKQGLALFFTIDAGPNVVVFTEPKDFETVKAELEKLPEISILESRIGEGPKFL